MKKFKNGWWIVVTLWLSAFMVIAPIAYVWRLKDEYAFEQVNILIIAAPIVIGFISCLVSLWIIDERPAKRVSIVEILFGISFWGIFNGLVFLGKSPNATDVPAGGRAADFILTPDSDYETSLQYALWCGIIGILFLIAAFIYKKHLKSK